MHQACARNERLTVQEERSRARTWLTCRAMQAHMVQHSATSQRQNETSPESRQRTAPATTNKWDVPRKACCCMLQHQLPAALMPHRTCCAPPAPHHRCILGHKLPHCGYLKGVSEPPHETQIETIFSSQIPGNGYS